MGDPTIKVFKAVEADWRPKYLDDESWANQQLQRPYRTALGQVSRNAPLILPLSRISLTNLTESNPNIYLLFEGVGAGKGRLVLNLLKGGQKVGEFPPVYFDLRDIKNLYERWTVDDESYNGSVPVGHRAALQAGRLPPGSPPVRLRIRCERRESLHSVRAWMEHRSRPKKSILPRRR
jgi:hypothetical protein